MNKVPPAPHPGQLLYENLFARRRGRPTFEAIASGLIAVSQNATALLEEAGLLANAERFARAGFLVATADEEMAKSYILLDACRLRCELHEGPLRRLCRAFYGHTEKHAYNKVLRFGHVRDLQQARKIFQLELRRSWPSADPESGEPDMPHETYFTREANLYVDYIEYDQAWSVPEPNRRGIPFDQIPGPNELDKSRMALECLFRTEREGLYTPDALEILNAVFGDCYITEKTATDELRRLYARLTDRLAEKLGGDRGRFEQTAYFEWPLYHFLQG